MGGATANQVLLDKKRKTIIETVDVSGKYVDDLHLRILCKLLYGATFFLLLVLFFPLLIDSPSSVCVCVCVCVCMNVSLSPHLSTSSTTHHSFFSLSLRVGCCGHFLCASRARSGSRVRR
jgi:hypothetical protein